MSIFYLFVQQGFSPERALFVRLHLLQAVIAFHHGGKIKKRVNTIVTN